ncbi:MAG: carbohydrate ABC transporter permease, partial [Anaerolineales bacterium]
MLRKYLPILVWTTVIFGLFLLLRALLQPYAAGISLTREIILARLREIGFFVLAILGGMAIVEIYLYQIFFRAPRNQLSAIIVRLIQGIFALFALQLIVQFFDITDLIRLPEGPVKDFFSLPSTLFVSLSRLISQPEDNASVSAGLGIFIFMLVFALIQKLTQPRTSRLGFAYLLVVPAFIGVLFLIVYPFLFEIKLAFSNASLGTQATKNASYGLIYGWENLKTLFTGNVAKDAKFFEVLWRTVLWTVINVTFHVTGGMILALLLHRPMRLQGFYRTLLVFPWAIPTTIAAMALRNEFDLRYGFFNIMLSNIHNFFEGLAAKATLLTPLFAWLAEHIGPVSWKQDPF